MSNVVIPYSPRGWAKEFHESGKRWKVLVLHRRAGKTTACINHLIRDVMQTPNGRFGYIAPYFKQAKAVAWDFLKYFSRPIPGITVNESELRVDYPNGGRIQLFGADNPDALRGLGLWGVIFDEYSQQPSSIFTEVVRPALSDHKGYAIWIGTPKGRNDFYRMYATCGVDEVKWNGMSEDEKEKYREGWYIKMLRASESGIVDEEELADARRTMSLDEYNQEYECSFEAALKGAYYSGQLAECRGQGRIGDVPWNKDVKVMTFWDLGMSDTTCIVFAQKVGREIHIIDYISDNGKSLEDYAMMLRRKPYEYYGHYLPHDIKVRELGTGRSRYEVMGKFLGSEMVRVVKNVPVKDGIEAVRKVFGRLWFDESKCLDLLDALASYTQKWNDKKGMFEDKPLHNWASHPSDAVRMLGVGIEEEFLSHRSHGVSSKYNKKSQFNKFFRKYGGK